MLVSPKEPIPWIGALLAALALSTGCGPAGAGDDSLPSAEPPWGQGCTAGKCDGLEGVTLAVCGARDVATGRAGCTQPSATDIGIDPLIAEKKAPLHVALRGLDHPGVAVAMEITDDQGQLVRSLSLTDLRDGTHVLYWDGQTADGQDATAPWHSLRLRATYGSDAIASEEHTIATLVNLPDEGPGYDHPRGTDRKDTDDWGRTHVVRALTDVAAAWSHEPRIAYLDLSLQNGGEFRPHWNHRHGECVDLRYVRDDGEGKLDLRWDKDHYDRQATQELADALVAHGAIEIFADKRADLEGDFVVFVAGHTNHLHATFGLFEGDTGEERVVNQGRVGGPCADDSDCNVRDGFCLMPEGETVGTCTAPCETACSDYVGGIYTLNECVETADGQLCVPARDFDRYPETSGCREGLEPTRAASLDQDGDQTDICWYAP